MIPRFTIGNQLKTSFYLHTPPIIATSIGDLAGIGAEVLIKSLLNPEVTEKMTPVIYASEHFLRSRSSELELTLFPFKVVKSVEESEQGIINVIEPWSDDVSIELGTPSMDSGRCSLLSLERASNDLKEGHMDALVTAPIDKKNIQKSGFKFPGHTEYLADLSSAEDYLMLLVSGGLRVGMVTGHIPVSRVAEELNKEIILNRIKVLNRSLRADFGISEPRLAILGLNPHAGNQGVIGTEEIEIITPAIESAKRDNIRAEGPFPADGFFGSDKKDDFDAVLAMYHDQGLVPFKALSFGKGVNFTAGLPIVRTSPDHGTAYDIAAQCIADSSSFTQALNTALDIVENRSSVLAS